MTEQIITLNSQSSADAVAQVLRYLPLDGSVEIVIRQVSTDHHEAELQE